MFNDKAGGGKHALAKNLAYKILIAVRLVEDGAKFLTANLNGDVGHVDQPERKPSSHVFVSGLQWIGFEGTSGLHGFCALLRGRRPPLLCVLRKQIGTKKQ